MSSGKAEEGLAIVPPTVSVSNVKKEAGERISRCGLVKGARMHMARAKIEAEKDKDKALHIALRGGKTNRILVKELLEQGASPTKKNGDGLTPLDTAAIAGNVECFKMVFKKAVEIERKKDDYQSCVVDRWKNAVRSVETEEEGKIVKLQKALKEMSPVQLYCVMCDQEEPQGEEEPASSSLWAVLFNAHLTENSQVAIFKAIFDRCLFGDKLVVTNTLKTGTHAACLPACECTCNGEVKGISLFYYLGVNLSLCAKLGKHRTLKAYVESQWWKKMKIFWLQFLYYLFQMLVLTCALAIAARPGLTDAEINLYPAPVDHFRGICEGLLFIMMVAKVIGEIVEIVFTPKHTYLLDVLNYLQWSSTLLTLTIVPLRILNHPGQWIVASLAYVFHALKALSYFTKFKCTGTYVFTLIIIVFRDITKFVLIFLVALITFTGSFCLSLRYDDSAVFYKNGNSFSGSGFNSDQRNLTGEGDVYHEVLFTGMRSFIESGSVLTYYGEGGGFGVLSVFLYLAFLFMVVIILLNVLIAQLSDTYTDVRSEAAAVFLRHQCWYLAKVEDQKCSACLPYYFCRSLFHWKTRKSNTCSRISDKESLSIAKAAELGPLQKLVKAFTAAVSLPERDSIEDILDSKIDELESKMDERDKKLDHKMDEMAKQLKDLTSILEKIAPPGQQSAS